MKIIITDTRNKDYKEIKELTPIQLVDIVEESVKAEKFCRTEWLKFEFQDYSKWNTDCVKFIDDTAKEMAVRDVMIYGNQSLNFKTSNQNEKHAKITRRNLTLKDSGKIASVAVQRYNDNDDLILYGFQSKTGRPILPNSVDMEMFYRAKFDPTV